MTSTPFHLHPGDHGFEDLQIYDGLGNGFRNGTLEEFSCRFLRWSRWGGCRVLDLFVWKILVKKEATSNHSCHVQLLSCAHTRP